MRLGTFLEVTGGAEARDGVRGSAREVNDEHTGDVPLSPMSSSLIRWSYCWLPDPISARVWPKTEGCRTAKFDFLS